LRATTDAVEAVKESDTVVIAPTPVRGCVADLSYLKGGSAGCSGGAA